MENANKPKARCPSTSTTRAASTSGCCVSWLLMWTQWELTTHIWCQRGAGWGLAGQPMHDVLLHMRRKTSLSQLTLKSLARRWRFTGNKSSMSWRMCTRGCNVLISSLSVMEQKLVATRTILYFIAQNVYFYTLQCKRPLFLLTFSPRGVKVNKDCDLLHRQVQIDTLKTNICPQPVAGKFQSSCWI